MGMGLISMYQSTLDLIKSMASLGLDTTGVREISVASNNKKELVFTVSVIHRWSLILAMSATIICIILSSQISIWAFDSESYSTHIAWLAISLFFNILAVGELVILQGLRQIGYMIKSGLIWNISALIFLTPLYYTFGIDAIIPVFIIVSIITYLSTLYYRKKINVNIVSIPFHQLLTKGKFILRIGFFIVLAAIQTQITLFVVRSMVINRIGLEQLGLLQAAWTITNVYLTLILKSMSADFYPRLSIISFDNRKIRKLINEQVYIILIISLPVIIFLLLASKLLLSLLYSANFETAYTLLNWRTIGIFFKVISWALSFVLLARGKGLMFFISDTSYSIIYLVCIYILFPYYQLDSVGIAYMIAYVSYLLIVYLLIRKLFGFRWTKSNLTTAGFCLTLIVLTFYFVQYSSVNIFLIGFLSISVSLGYSLYKLNQVVQLKDLFHKIRI
nr:oligosaccharide flippase family protein [Dysgonomonas sp. Marseille-P4677]